MKPIKIRLILVVFLSIICFNSHSQIYYAGHNLAIYADINPDTLINYTCSAGGSSIENYYFDVNKDLQNDFQIKALCVVAGAATSAYITITSLNPYAYIRLGRLDSVYNSFMTYWWVTKIVQPLQYGDSINSNISKWDSTALYLTDNSYMTGTFKYVPDWISTSDKYIGIKYQDTVDTIYGWIRVKCPNVGSCYIKDYSFAGAGLGIINFEIGSANIYPTPATDKIYIAHAGNNAIELSLFDIVGKQVSETLNPKNQRAEMEVSGLSEGVYFLQIKTGEGMLTRKIVVQR